MLLRDAIDTLQEIAKLIKFSPKQSNLLNKKLVQSEAGQPGVSIKLLCPTRWTARSAAINSVLKDYTVLIEAMEEINLATRDVSANVSHLLLFGSKLFIRAEEVSRVFQAKDTCLQDALKAIWNVLYENGSCGFYFIT